jgi:hypothetical protein
MKKTISVLGFDNIEVERCRRSDLGDGITFELTQMYNAPDISYKEMKKVADYFGTVEMDFQQDISDPGCDTCDWGSRYGYTVYIYKITKNNPFKEDEHEKSTNLN